jgi:hypothetical protein
VINRIFELISGIWKYPSLKRRYEENLAFLEQNQKELFKAYEWKKKYNDLVFQLTKKDKLEEWEDYWTDKHPKKDIYYSREETDGDYKIDVRSFFMPSSDYPTITGDSYDEIAKDCLVWVMEKVKYISDKIVYGYNEYWAFPYQTLDRLEGDCEDGSILLANIMLHNGIPDWRVRVNAGDVKEPFGDKTVGHAYVTYCRETDNQWVVLDWCYFTNYKAIKDRELHKDKKDYYGIWFSFTRDQAYGNLRYMKGMPENFKIGDRNGRR